MFLYPFLDVYIIYLEIDFVKRYFVFSPKKGTKKEGRAPEGTRPVLNIYSDIYPGGLTTLSVCRDSAYSSANQQPKYHLAYALLFLRHNLFFKRGVHLPQYLVLLPEQRPFFPAGRRVAV